MALKILIAIAYMAVGWITIKGVSKFGSNAYHKTGSRKLVWYIDSISPRWLDTVVRYGLVILLWIVWPISATIYGSMAGIALLKWKT